MVAVIAAVAVAATAAAIRLAPGWGVLPAALIVLPIVAWGAHAISSRVSELHLVLTTALGAFRDRDFGLRLTVRGDREVAELKRLYNELADTVRADRRDLQRKEILLETILQRTPLAVVLANQADRIIYSNNAARDLLGNGARVNDRLLDELELADPLREALEAPGDAIINFGEETFHVSQRTFELNMQRHRLLLIERLTPELRRQEVDVWKRAIRVINHELNNTIAPISSLLHSARRVQDAPEHRHRLTEIYGIVDERLAHLRRFLEAYASFARLPEPRKQRVAWRDVIEAVRPLYAIRVEGSLALECLMDPGQIEQVLINLVKNAHEAGGDPQEVVVSVQRAGSDCVVRVLDRGTGMTDEEIRQALRPFYSTKPGGSGVGLALCNEIVDAHGGRLRLQRREGGGTAVTLAIPAAD